MVKFITSTSNINNTDNTIYNRANIMDLAERKVEDLQHLHDWGFLADRTERQLRLHAAIVEIENILEPFCNATADTDRARFAYLKGRALSFLPQNLSRAEELLTKSVKQDPRNPSAWTALGHCLWARGRLEEARGCLSQSLEHGETAEALRQLSMIVRQIQSKSSDPAVVMDESIRFAKRAIELDVNHHVSWYVLGNAHCTRFFSVSHDVMDLKKAIVAYDRSEKLGGIINPDLYFNRGNVLRYLQEYDAACFAYRRSKEIDPHMQGVEEAIENITDFLFRTAELVVSGGKLKRKRLAALQSDLSSHALTSSVPVAVGGTVAAKDASWTTLRALGVGNASPSSSAPVSPGGVTTSPAGASLALKVLMSVTKGNVPPESFLCMDVEGTFAVLSVYNLGVDGTAQFDTDETIVIIEPMVKHVLATSRIPDTARNGSGSSEAKTAYAFSVVQVQRLERISIGGRFLRRSSIAAPSLTVDVFSG